MKTRAASATLGIRRGMPAKRRPKRFLRKLVNYLKSDSYMFAPIISSSPSNRKYGSSHREGFHVNAAGFEIGGEAEEGKKKKKERLVEYLRSDSYFYAPLIEGECAPEKVAEDPTSEGTLCLMKRVTTSVVRTVLTRKTTHQPTVEARDTIAKCQTEPFFDTNHESDNGGDQILQQGEIVKQVVFPNGWKSLFSEGDFPGNGSVAEQVVHRRKIPVE